MKWSEARSPRIRGSGFRAIAWILLLAFTLQSFVTETHIHGAFDGGPAHARTAANAFAHGKAPVKNGKTDCPFCQAIVHAGAFYAPPAQILILPITWAKIAASLFAVQTFVNVSSHLWRSRAPPTA